MNINLVFVFIFLPYIDPGSSGSCGIAQKVYKKVKEFCAPMIKAGEGAFILAMCDGLECSTDITIQNFDTFMNDFVKAISNDQIQFTPRQIPKYSKKFETELLKNKAKEEMQRFYDEVFIKQRHNNIKDLKNAIKVVCKYVGTENAYGLFEGNNEIFRGLYERLFMLYNIENLMGMQTENVQTEDQIGSYIEGKPILDDDVKTLLILYGRKIFLSYYMKMAEQSNPVGENTNGNGTVDGKKIQPDVLLISEAKKYMSEYEAERIRAFLTKYNGATDGFRTMISSAVEVVKEANRLMNGVNKSIEKFENLYGINLPKITKNGFDEILEFDFFDGKPLNHVKNELKNKLIYILTLPEVPMKFPSMMRKIKNDKSEKSSSIVSNCPVNDEVKQLLSDEELASIMQPYKNPSSKILEKSIGYSIVVKNTNGYYAEGIKEGSECDYFPIDGVDKKLLLQNFAKVLEKRYDSILSTVKEDLVNQLNQVSTCIEAIKNTITNPSEIIETSVKIASQNLKDIAKYVKELPQMLPSAPEEINYKIKEVKEYIKAILNIPKSSENSVEANKEEEETKTALERVMMTVDNLVTSFEGLTENLSSLIMRNTMEKLKQLIEYSKGIKHYLHKWLKEEAAKMINIVIDASEGIKEYFKTLPKEEIKASVTSALEQLSAKLPTTPTREDLETKIKSLVECFKTLKEILTPLIKKAAEEMINKLREYVEKFKKTLSQISREDAMKKINELIANCKRITYYLPNVTAEDVQEKISNVVDSVKIIIHNYYYSPSRTEVMNQIKNLLLVGSNGIQNITPTKEDALAMVNKLKENFDQLVEYLSALSLQDAMNKLNDITERVNEIKQYLSTLSDGTKKDVENLLEKLTALKTTLPITLPDFRIGLSYLAGVLKNMWSYVPSYWSQNDSDTKENEDEKRKILDEAKLQERLEEIATNKHYKYEGTILHCHFKIIIDSESIKSKGRMFIAYVREMVQYVAYNLPLAVGNVARKKTAEFYQLMNRILEDNDETEEGDSDTSEESDSDNDTNEEGGEQTNSGDNGTSTVPRSIGDDDQAVSISIGDAYQKVSRSIADVYPKVYGSIGDAYQKVSRSIADVYPKVYGIGTKSYWAVIRSIGKNALLTEDDSMKLRKLMIALTVSIVGNEHVVPPKICPKFGEKLNLETIQPAFEEFYLYCFDIKKLTIFDSEKVKRVLENYNSFIEANADVKKSLGVLQARTTANDHLKSMCELITKLAMVFDKGQEQFNLRDILHESEVINKIAYGNQKSTEVIKIACRKMFKSFVHQFHFFIKLSNSRETFIREKYKGFKIYNDIYTGKESDSEPVRKAYDIVISKAISFEKKKYIDLLKYLMEKGNYDVLKNDILNYGDNHSNAPPVESKSAANEDGKSVAE